MRRARQRSTRDVLDDHLRLRRKALEAVEEDLRRNYAEDVVLLTGFGVFRGHEGVRHSARILHGQLPCVRYRYGTKLVEGELAFLEWTARCRTAVVKDGADSFLIRGGLIVAQTIHYTVCKVPKSGGRPGPKALPPGRHGEARGPSGPPYRPTRSGTILP